MKTLDKLLIQQVIPKTNENHGKKGKRGKKTVEEHGKTRRPAALSEGKAESGNCH